MADTLYYENVNIGQAIPELLKHPTNRQLVQWCAVSGEYSEIHYDKDFAINKGLPGVVVQGMLTMSFLGQMITDWSGEQGTLKKLSVNYRAMVFPNQDLICKGIVTKKYVENNQSLIACDIWLENEKGEKVVTGEANVSLPSRN
jgi:acyl dehydratase